MPQLTVEGLDCVRGTLLEPNMLQLLHDMEAWYIAEMQQPENAGTESRPAQWTGLVKETKPSSGRPGRKSHHPSSND